MAANYFSEAKFSSDSKFTVSPQGQIPDLKLGGASALNNQTTTTTANNAPKSTTGGIEYYRYPRQMMDSTCDYIQLKVVQYKQTIDSFSVSNVSPFINTQSQEQAQGLAETNSSETPVGFVILPMPQNISDSNAVEWGSSSLNPLEAAALAGASTFINTASGQTKMPIQDVLKGFASGSLGAALNPENIKAMTTGISGAAVNFAGGNVNLRSLISRTTGQILNPNQELLFEGPTLRSFSFIFDLVPRYAAEGQEILDMIRFLKKSMATKSAESTNGLFLSAPNLFRIRYMNGRNEHPFLNRFKTCALTNMTVNYTASNTYATYDDGTPIHVQLGLNFSEINPIYAQDYKDDLGGVGY